MRTGLCAGLGRSAVLGVVERRLGAKRHAPEGKSSAAQRSSRGEARLCLGSAMDFCPVRTNASPQAETAWEKTGGLYWAQAQGEVLGQAGSPSNAARSVP